MTRSGQRWYDDESGPMVRLYAMTRGRARPAGPVLDLVALVIADTVPERDLTLSPEQVTILQLCRTAVLSVAEIAAHADLPLNVVRILLADLLDGGHIRVLRPTSPSGAPGEHILREVINGLRAL